MSITDSRLRFETVTTTKQRLHVQSEMDGRVARGASQRSGKRQQRESTWKITGPGIRENGPTGQEFRR